jgi:hypothetical protein
VISGETQGKGDSKSPPLPPEEMNMRLVRTCSKANPRLVSGITFSRGCLLPSTSCT